MKPWLFIKRRPGLTLGIFVLAGFAFALSVPTLHWRLQVLALHLTGKIPDIELGELIGSMMPGSDQSMTRLIETRNPHAVIKNSRVSPADIAAGGDLYRRECSNCHAPDGSGGQGAPALVRRTYKHGAGDWAIYRTIRLGVPNTAMSPHPLPPTQLWQLVAYVRSLDIPDQSANAVAVAKPIEILVPAAEIEAIAKPAEDWLTYSGSFTSTRHSALRQVTPENVTQLGLRWQHQFEGEPGKVETSPIVRQGIMFITVPPGRVMALDATTGTRLWMQQYRPAGKAAGGEFGTPVNRGVAVLDGNIYFGTGDAHLIALSAATGKEVWNVATSSDPTRYFISSAPLAFRDVVVTGVGTKGGGIGYIAAFDAKTGQERWRFMAIPGPNEPGNNTWAGNSWREGGAPTWLTGSYDAQQDLLLWGAGNPKPDYDAAARAGDNLYSNSVVALQGSTGKLIWHFQFTPADDRDWDSNQIPVLVDRPAGHSTEKLLLWANRNGFYYVLDRISGKFLNATAFVQQTWTDGIDANGRPLPRKDLDRSRQGFMLFPGNVGGTNWWSPSFDSELDLIFVPVIEQGMVFFPSARSWPTASNRSFYTAVRALEARTGKLVWEYKRAPRIMDSDIGGVLSTDTGLLFGSDQSTFFALDSRTGKELWSVETGGNISSPPVTYQANGRQFMVISAGRNLMSFALPKELQPSAALGARPTLTKR